MKKQVEVKKQTMLHRKNLEIFIGIEGYDFNGYQLEKEFNTKIEPRIHRFFFEMIQIPIS